MKNLFIIIFIAFIFNSSVQASNSIVTGVISPLTFCGTAPVNVPYTAGGTFNPGNIFTAQLSEANGNFTNAQTIGTLSSITSGTINATIPNGVSTGSAYRIRVISSDPVIIGTINPNPITFGETLLPNVWTQKPTGGFSSRTEAVGFSIGTKGYLVTGDDGNPRNDMWEYNTVTSTWAQKVNLPASGRSEACGFSIGNKGYIGTGISFGVYLNDFWEYDQAGNTWTSRASYPTACANAVGFSIGNKGYIGTGRTSSGYNNSFLEYDPITNIWAPKAVVPGGNREGASGFSIGTNGYLGTGASSSGYKLDFYQYNPISNSWTPKTNFSGGARTNAFGFNIGHKGYIGTGHDGAGRKNTFYEYDALANSWTFKNFVPTTSGPGRDGAVGFGIGTKGYMGTGMETSRKLDFYEYDPSPSIFTEAITPLSYCAGANISVPYSIIGTFQCNNAFFAFLSDPSGSFSTSFNLGFVFSRTSGTINVTLPTNIPASSLYRIRVVSTSPTATGNDNGSNITISLVNCNDGNPCTFDFNDANCVCQHSPLNVDDNNVCTVDGCNTLTGPTHVALPIVDDGNVCTGDGCNPITGPTHIPLNIVSDNNACTTDGCNSLTGPTHVIDPIEDDGIACTDDGCDSATGVYHHETTPGCQPSGYNCYLKNITQVSANIIDFDIWLEWQGTASNKFLAFQAGINFNYSGLSNGGNITGDFVPGSADASLTLDQQNPNWVINSTSHQIRLLAALHPLDVFSIAIPNPPGFRIGKFRMTNTVPYSTGANINFQWMFLIGTSTTTQTGVFAYLDGSNSATNITQPNYVTNSPSNIHAVHLIENTIATCPTAHSAGPYTSCGDIQLNGYVNFLNTGTWSTTGSGTFLPNANATDAVYHPSSADLSSGSVSLTLTADPSGACPTSAETSLVIFTSVDDGNPCTTDGCDSQSGLATHNPVNIDDVNACTVDACNSQTGTITHSPVNIDDGILCTYDGCNSVTGVFHGGVYADCQANRYNCYLKNTRQISSNVMEFDIIIEWTGTNTARLEFLQAGINFNYDGIANGGVLTGAYVTGSNDPLLNPNPLSLNWSINQTSKQIRMQFGGSTQVNNQNVPGPPGFRIGTFRITNTVPFASCSNTNFEWKFLTGSTTTSQTQIAFYINGASFGESVTLPNYLTDTPGNPFAIHTVQDLTLECTTLQLKAFIEGFYIGNNTMRAVIDPLNSPAICDVMTIELHSTIAPYNILYSANGNLDIFGNGTFIFPFSAQGSSYYIVTKHRNAIETWSKLPVLFSNSVTIYDFTDDITKAMGNNLRDLGDGNFALYSGNLNSDLQINSNDVDLFEAATSDFLTGYSIYDLNGDGIVESADYSLLENNLQLLVIKP